MWSEFLKYCFQIILPLRLPLAKGAAERSEAEGFAPTEMWSEFLKYCFQIIFPYLLRANPPLIPPLLKGGS